MRRAGSFRNGIATAWAGALLVLAAAAPATAQVTVYEHCDYGGRAVELPLGTYDLADLQARGVGNDALSSVRVQAGTTVELYEHAAFQGRELRLDADHRCLVDAGFNDLASSLRVAGLAPSHPDPADDQGCAGGTFWNGYQCQPRQSAGSCGCRPSPGGSVACVDGGRTPGGQPFWYVRVGGSGTTWQAGTDARCCTARAEAGYALGQPAPHGAAPCVFATSREGCERLLADLGCSAAGIGPGGGAGRAADPRPPQGQAPPAAPPMCWFAMTSGGGALEIAPGDGSLAVQGWGAGRSTLRGDVMTSGPPAAYPGGALGAGRSASGQPASCFAAATPTAAYSGTLHCPATYRLAGSPRTYRGPEGDTLRFLSPARLEVLLPDGTRRTFRRCQRREGRCSPLAPCPDTWPSDDLPP